MSSSPMQSTIAVNMCDGHISSYLSNSTESIMDWMDHFHSGISGICHHYFGKLDYYWNQIWRKRKEKSMRFAVIETAKWLCVCVWPCVELVFFCFFFPFNKLKIKTISRKCYKQSDVSSSMNFENNEELEHKTKALQTMLTQGYLYIHSVLGQLRYSIQTILKILLRIIRTISLTMNLKL